MKIYIQAAAQVSIQKPLSEEWMIDPRIYAEPLVYAINPDFKKLISAGEARRMSKIMKRAIVTAMRVMDETGIIEPDAIITGTGKGCLEYTEKFLGDMVINKEQMLSPTFFMQSTHNTVGATLSIITHNHNYNVTYSHGGLSFDQSLLDAWAQLKIGNIRNALVGGHDEMVESYYNLLRKTGYVGEEGMVPCGEVAMSMMLGLNKSDKTLCELAGIRLFNNPSYETLATEIDKMLDDAHLHVDDISSIMTGMNGRKDNDEYYHKMATIFFPGKPLLRYKHLFGENYTSSALGVYASAHILQNGSVPSFMYCDNFDIKESQLHNLMVINHTNKSDCSIILLKKI